MNFNGRLARIERNLGATDYSPPTLKAYIGACPCEWDDGPLPSDWKVHHHAAKGYNCFRDEATYNEWCQENGLDPNR